MTATTIRDAVLLDHLITFGPDHHPEPDAVVTIFGCDEEQARAITHALYGPHWCSIYSGPEKDRYMAKWPTSVVLTVQITGPDAA